jgi:hypothetical protein
MKTLIEEAGESQSENTFEELKSVFYSEPPNFIFSLFTGEGSSFLNFSRGDLILLDEEATGETVLNSGWCSGVSERTGEKGDFPAESVYVLPSLNKPPDDILVRQRQTDNSPNESTVRQRHTQIEKTYRQTDTKADTHTWKQVYKMTETQTVNQLEMQRDKKKDRHRQIDRQTINKLDR